MEAFWASLGWIFIAELGDKTQLVAMSLAARYRAPVVLAGIFTATFVVHLISVALGGFAGKLLPSDWIRFLAGIAFIGFGLWTLRGDCLEEDEEAGICKRQAAPFWVVTITFFLAELGDKTMLSTVTLASTNSVIPVWIGSSLGMVISDGLAILVGQLLGKQLPEKIVKTGAAVIFFAFGAYSVVSEGIKLPVFAWGIAAIAVAALFFILFKPHKADSAYTETIQVEDERKEVGARK